MANLMCKILGFVFLLVGVAGFIKSDLLGMHLSNVHNAIHLISGGLALYFGFAASLQAARTFSLVFGAVYLLLGILGFVAPDVVANVIQAHHSAAPAGSLMPDNIVHLLLGGLFLIVGLARAGEKAVVGDERRV